PVPVAVVGAANADVAFAQVRARDADHVGAKRLRLGLTLLEPKRRDEGHRKLTDVTAVRRSPLYGRRRGWPTARRLRSRMVRKATRGKRRLGVLRLVPAFGFWPSSQPPPNENPKAVTSHRTPKEPPSGAFAA